MRFRTPPVFTKAVLAVALCCAGTAFASEENDGITVYNGLFLSLTIPPVAQAKKTCR